MASLSKCPCVPESNGCSHATHNNFLKDLVIDFCFECQRGTVRTQEPKKVDSIATQTDSAMSLQNNQNSMTNQWEKRFWEFKSLQEKRDGYMLKMQEEYLKKLDVLLEENVKLRSERPSRKPQVIPTVQMLFQMWKPSVCVPQA